MTNNEIKALIKDDIVINTTLQGGFGVLNGYDKDLYLPDNGRSIDSRFTKTKRVCRFSKTYNSKIYDSYISVIANDWDFAIYNSSYSNNDLNDGLNIGYLWDSGKWLTSKIIFIKFKTEKAKKIFETINLNDIAIIKGKNRKIRAMDLRKSYYESKKTLDL
jgi:hypothetical protein